MVFSLPYEGMGGVDHTRCAALGLAQILEPGDFIALWGDMGAGKTAFVRWLAQGLGTRTNVASPTFTILTAHEGGRLALFHFDAYRVGSEEEMLDLGFEEFAYGDGVTALEWPQRIPSLLPQARIDVYIDITGDITRRIRIERRTLSAAMQEGNG